MKNFIRSKIYMLLIITITVISCSKEDSVVDDLTDSILIEQIQNSKLIEINFKSLPQPSKYTIQNSYVPNGDSPNKSFESPSLGYKVNLVGRGRTVDVFFNTEGRELMVDGDSGSDEGDREDGGEDTEGDDDERSGNGDSGSSGDERDGERDGDDSTESCWIYTYPITYIMIDGTEIQIENEGDYTKIRQWEESNPNLDSEITLVFPITIQHRESQTTTIESPEKLREWEEENCNYEERDGDGDRGDGDSGSGDGGNRGG